MCNTGAVFNVQRFSTVDGPGIRTVVFLKGCPLNCIWCHNPEAKNTSPVIFYDEQLCIGCRACEQVCGSKCHSFKDEHLFNRNDCKVCSTCAKVCPSTALKLCGEKKTTEDVMDTVIKDKPFYDESGGGITVSGGEPLMQFDFTLSLLKSAKEHGLNTAIETSGFTVKDIKELNPYVDLWLYDIKIFDDEDHIKYTGVSNGVIFNNLRALDKSGAKIILRCPIISEINLNAEHFNRIAKLSNELENLCAVHLETYDPLGISKAKQIGEIPVYQNEKFLEVSQVMSFADEIREKMNVKLYVM